jgi:SAM-dependent methyltransferase
MRILPKYSDELNLLSTYVAAEADGKPVLRVLEAGCGREWYLRTHGLPIEITGVDLDGHALDYRQNVRKDLHRAIPGDLRTVELPAAHYDVVYSSFVLEHIEGAERALDNMVTALKPGGLLIVRVPDLGGFQTFMARLLPHWAAVLYYRHGWKIEKAGQPGFAPYPTHYDPVISSQGFEDYCRRAGLSIVDEIGVGSYADRGTGSLSRLVPLAARAAAVASLGKVHDRYVDLTFVARKGEA